MSKSALNRRRFLQGLAGSTLALPLLEANAQTVFPKRLVIVYTPNGFNIPSWLPTGGETTFQLSPILSPLAPYRSKLLITYGLQYSAGLAYNGDGHAQGMQVALTGRLNNNPVNNGLASGISVDQEVANKVGLATRFKSYPFGVRTNEFGGAWRYTSFYGSNSPVQPKNNPYEAFTQLFGGTQNAEQT
ncbi:MAG TPA: DUF1552 domain-containing protein, partial [Bdellovibrionales bacterium]|nr:DUF1552 domain-containing protein [Bdellovibrionales bacterium]